MKKWELKQMIAEMIRSELRKTELTKNTDSILMMSAIIDCIELDSESIIECIAEKEESKKNPIKVLLGLFGLKIVKEGDERAVYIKNTAEIEAFMKLNENRMKEVIKNITADMIENEKKQEETSSRIISKNNELNMALNREISEKEQLQTDIDNQRKVIAERIQYMLTLTDDSSQPWVKQIKELLDYFDLEVFESAENSGLSETAMFSVLKSGEHDNCHNKPCIVYKGEVFCKGIHFVTEKDDVKSNEEGVEI